MRGTDDGSATGSFSRLDHIVTHEELLRKWETRTPHDICGAMATGRLRTSGTKTSGSAMILAKTSNVGWTLCSKASTCCGMMTTGSVKTSGAKTSGNEMNCAKISKGC